MADLGYTKLQGKICCDKCKEYVCAVRVFRDKHSALLIKNAPIYSRLTILLLDMQQHHQ